MFIYKIVLKIFIAVDGNSQWGQGQWDRDRDSHSCGRELSVGTGTVG
jgi:hypothetical protein